MTMVTNLDLTGSRMLVTPARSSRLFVAAMKIAAPGIVILLMVSVLMGVIARTVPQINILIVGFPLQIGVGLIVVGASMIYFTDQVVKLFEAMRADLSAAISLFGG